MPKSRMRSRAGSLSKSDNKSSSLTRNRRHSAPNLSVVKIKGKLKLRVFKGLKVLPRSYLNGVSGEITTLESSDKTYSSMYMQYNNTPMLLLNGMDNDSLRPETASELLTDIGQIHANNLPQTIVVNTSDTSDAVADQVKALVEKVVKDKNNQNLGDEQFEVTGPELIDLENGLFSYVFSIATKAERTNEPAHTQFQTVASSTTQSTTVQQSASSSSSSVILTNTDTQLFSVDEFKKATKSPGALAIRSKGYRNTVRALQDYHNKLSELESAAVVMQKLLAATAQQIDPLLKEKHGLVAKKNNLLTAIKQTEVILLEETNRLKDLNPENDKQAIEVINKRSKEMIADIKQNRVKIQGIDQSIKAKEDEIQSINGQLRSILKYNEKVKSGWQHQLNQAAEKLHIEVNSYLQEKESSTQSSKKDAVLTLQKQVSGRTQDNMRLREIVETVQGVPHENQLSQPMDPLPSSTVSTVYRVQVKGDIGTTGSRVGYAKKATMESNGTTDNLGFQADLRGRFNSLPADQQPNLIARQVVSSRVAEQLGLNVLAPEIFSVAHDGSVLGVTGEATGIAMMDRQPGVDRYRLVDLTNPKIQQGLAELQIIDAITGQMDRHLGNIFIDPDTGQVTGIDNDMAFPKDTVYDEGAPNSLHNQFSLDDDDQLRYNQTLIRKGIAERIIAMDRNELEKTLRGKDNDAEKLDQAAIDNALKRFDAVRDRCLQLQREGKLIENDGWNESTYQTALRERSISKEKHRNYLARAARQYQEAGSADNLNVQLAAGEL